jgi:hypothetical protein
MRTTLTLDDDIAAKLLLVARRSGEPFSDVVNNTLRLGLQQHSAMPSTSFRVITRDLGALRPGLSLDKVTDLLELLEGPLQQR